MKSEPIFSFLITADGPVQTCMGCTARLANKGLLRVMLETPIETAHAPVVNGELGVFTAVYYAITDDHTLEDCRREIRGRHVGPAWGARP